MRLGSVGNDFPYRSSDYSQYDSDGEFENNRLDSGIGYAFDLGLIANIIYIDVLFTVGYKIDDIKDENETQIFKGPFFGIGMIIWD